MTPEMRAEIEGALALLRWSQPAFNSREWEAIRRLEHVLELDANDTSVCASCGDVNRRPL